MKLLSIFLLHLVWNRVLKIVFLGLFGKRKGFLQSCNPPVSGWVIAPGAVLVSLSATPESGLVAIAAAVGSVLDRRLVGPSTSTVVAALTPATG